MSKNRMSKFRLIPGGKRVHPSLEIVFEDRFDNEIDCMNTVYYEVKRKIGYRKFYHDSRFCPQCKKVRILFPVCAYPDAPPMPVCRQCWGDRPVPYEYVWMGEQRDLGYIDEHGEWWEVGYVDFIIDPPDKWSRK